MPGVPDVYQGTEWWDDSLVDPDNRRAVDFESRRSVLRALDATGELPPVDRTAAAKLWVVIAHLAAAPESPRAVQRLSTAAARSGLARATCWRLIAGCDHGGDRTAGGAAAVRAAGATRAWSSNARLEDAFTGRRHAGRVAVADLLARYPVAVLVPR